MLRTILFLYVYECFTCKCICTIYMYSFYGGQERAKDPLEWWTIVSHHWHSGSWPHSSERESSAFNLRFISLSPTLIPMRYLCKFSGIQLTISFSVFISIYLTEFWKHRLRFEVMYQLLKCIYLIIIHTYKFILENTFERVKERTNSPN